LALKLGSSMGRAWPMATHLGLEPYWQKVTARNLRGALEMSRCEQDCGPRRKPWISHRTLLRARQRSTRPRPIRLATIRALGKGPARRETGERPVRSRTASIPPAIGLAISDRSAGRRRRWWWAGPGGVGSGRAPDVAMMQAIKGTPRIIGSHPLPRPEVAEPAIPGRFVAVHAHPGCR
jgi:hypothetical protein